VCVKAKGNDYVIAPVGKSLANSLFPDFAVTNTERVSWYCSMTMVLSFWMLLFFYGCILLLSCTRFLDVCPCFSWCLSGLMFIFVNL